MNLPEVSLITSAFLSVIVITITVTNELHLNLDISQSFLFESYSKNNELNGGYGAELSENSIN